MKKDERSVECSSCGKLPGKDSDITYRGSEPINEEASQITVQGWIPLARILETIDQTIEKIFPPRDDS